jgi:hypothetical protein
MYLDIPIEIPCPSHRLTTIGLTGCGSHGEKEKPGRPFGNRCRQMLPGGKSHTWPGRSPVILGKSENVGMEHPLKISTNHAKMQQNDGTCNHLMVNGG